MGHLHATTIHCPNLTSLYMVIGSVSWGGGSYDYWFEEVAKTTEIGGTRWWYRRRIYNVLGNARWGDATRTPEDNIIVNGYPHARHRCHRRPFIQYKIHYAPPHRWDRRRPEWKSSLYRRRSTFVGRDHENRGGGGGIETNAAAVARTVVVARREWHAPRHTLAVTSWPIDQKSDSARARVRTRLIRHRTQRAAGRGARAYDGGGLDGTGLVGITLRRTRQGLCADGTGVVRWVWDGPKGSALLYY